MRQLKISSPKKAKRTINYLNQELKGKFPVNSSAWILSNSDEGKYGWLSTNYLLHGQDIRLDNQVGSLDWGGGSAEITYATQEPSVDQVKFFNQSVNNVVVDNLIQRIYKSHGQKRTVEFIERLKNLSSNLSKKVSISLGLKETLIFKEQRLRPRQKEQNAK